MKRIYQVVILLLPVFCSSFSSCAQIANNNQQTVNTRPAVLLPAGTEEKNFGGFSIKIPTSWKLYQSGNCAEISFLSWDPNNTQRQFFCYATAGVFYLSRYQKQVDDNYVRMGGMSTPLIGTPIIDPFTPENYLVNFHLMAETPLFRMLAKVVQLHNVQILSVTPQVSGLRMPGVKTSLIRALYTDAAKTSVNEGLFLVSIAPFYLANSGPSANFGIGYSFTGVTAPVNEFETLLPALNKCLEGFTIDDNYAQNCMRQSNQQTEGVIRAGKTLAEGTDIMIKGWQARSRSTDISSAKTADAMMGRDRLYDPQTKQVFEVPNDFYDNYKSNQQKFNYNNLQKLPADNWELWHQPTQSGTNIKRVN